MGPDVSRRLRLQDMTAHEDGKDVSPMHQPPLSPTKYSWHSYLLEAELTPGPQYGQKDYVNEIF